MKGKGKAGSMNTIIREVSQELADIPNESPKSDIYIRAIKFSNNAEWVNPSFIPVRKFEWNDLLLDGSSNLGSAFTEISREFAGNTLQEGDHLLSILISDGYPTDDWLEPLAHMKNTLRNWDPIYCAVCIQDTADEVVTEFVGNDNDFDKRAMEMDNIESIIHIVRALVLDE